MKFARFMTVGLILISSAARAEGPLSVNSAWFQCHSNADCVAVQTACNKWEGVNKSYAKTFGDALPKWSSSAAGCPTHDAAIAQKKNSLPQCVRGSCAVLFQRMAP